MATPKKKTLIELMLEADVKWPDGAEYAAQDKDDNHVHFYKDGKPDNGQHQDQWMANRCVFIGREHGIELPSLCKKWNRTIVTSEEYAAAVAAKQDAAAGTATDDEWEPVGWGDWKVGDEVRFDGYTGDDHTHWDWVIGETYKIGEQGELIGPENIRGGIPTENWGFSFSRRKKQAAPDAPVVVEPSEYTTQAPTIEQLAAEHMKKLQEASAQQALADEAAKAAATALDELVAAGKVLGLVISVDANKELEQPVITDWRDLRVGDEIECIEPWGGAIKCGDIGVITKIDDDELFSTFEKQSPYYYKREHIGVKFRFIRRP